MKKTIWKFQFVIDDEFIIEMPFKAEILTAQNQYGLNCLWAIVQPENGRETRKFRVYGTGHPFNHDGVNLKYISTIQDGPLVWHIFEVI